MHMYYLLRRIVETTARNHGRDLNVDRAVLRVLDNPAFGGGVIVPPVETVVDCIEDSVKKEWRL